MRKYVADIESTEDLLERATKLAGLVTALFADAGYNLVVVGGSAVELYTEGAYMSGDIDFCRRSLEPIPLRMAQDLMARLGAVGGPRSWKVAGLFVDLLGMFENESKSPCRIIESPYGPVTIMPAELAIVERTLSAFYPQPDEEARTVAVKLLAVCMSNKTEVDWLETERLAKLPEFNVLEELRLLKEETMSELKNECKNSL